MGKKRGLILINQNTKIEILEQMFKLPVEERAAFLSKAVKEKKAVYLGSTDKSAPELAIECIKRGIKTRSYIEGDKQHAK